MAQNKDIGFIEAGQPAEIEIGTFNCTKRGLLHGTVLNVTQHAIPARQACRQGQVRVEIKAGSRRTIDYFLSPILRYQHERLRAR
jgi:hemolysin D